MHVAPAPAHAQEIYVWEDEDGIQHLSDRRPGGDYEIRVQRAIAQPRQPVTMHNVGSRREPEWRFTNHLHGPVTVEVRLLDAENTVSAPPLPARIELPAAGARSVLLGPIRPYGAWRYRIEIDALPGPLDPEADRSHLYRPPITPETALRIGQGFNGSFSHQAPHSRYAIDIPLEPGTPVVAARAGVVMDAERWFHRSGLNLERDGPRANYVRILHEDGSMAVYAHLDYAGVHVRPGQRVDAGQILGQSGNTGYSSGPHLHFAIQINAGMQLRAIPFRMLGHDGRELVLHGVESGPPGHNPGGMAIDPVKKNR
ncbi:MAG: M23 family metallopeptidase [Wenzhouxiangellaceae bacterium]